MLRSAPSVDTTHEQRRGGAGDGLLRRDAALEYALYAVAVVAVAYFAWTGVRAARFPFPLDYGEGPLVDQARQLARGATIYRARFDDYPFTVANYPPLFPAILGAWCKVFGFTFGAARALGLVAASACALLVAAIVRAAVADVRAALLGGALFLGVPYTLFWASFVRVDFVALAFSLAAVAVAAWRPDRRSTPLVCAALALAAALTRQSHLLAAPLAIAGSQIVVRPARAVVFVVALAAGAAASFVAIDAATLGGFSFNVVTANINRIDFGRYGYFLGDLAFTSAILVVVAARSAYVGSRRDPRAVLLALYLVGTALSALTIAKVGAALNYFLEIAAACAILCAVAFARRAELGPRRALVLALGLQAGWMLYESVDRPENPVNKLARRADFERLAAAIAAEPGEVLADETMGMLPIAGRPILLQPFEMAQLARQGIWDPSPVVADLRRGRFGLVLVADGPATLPAWTHERWTDEMLEALHERYEATGSLADATLYRPRRP